MKLRQTSSSCIKCCWGRVNYSKTCWVLRVGCLRKNINVIRLSFFRIMSLRLSSRTLAPIIPWGKFLGGLIVCSDFQAEVLPSAQCLGHPHYSYDDACCIDSEKNLPPCRGRSLKTYMFIVCAFAWGTAAQAFAIVLPALSGQHSRCPVGH